MKSKNVQLTTIKDTFLNREPGAENDYHFFGILVPIVAKDDGVHLLYEVRGSDLDRQPGEICFPGGALEPGETMKECAVRETCEELGIREEDIDVIAQLDTIYTTNNFAMVCYLGVIDEQVVENMKVNEVEVADTYMVPVSFFIDNPPQVYENTFVPVIDEAFPFDKVTGGEPYKWRGGKAQVPVYDEYEGHVLWGLTARITKRFIDVLTERKGEDV